ncbi:hypothetical protein F1514_007060 [Yersinia pestis]|nr:hypothetical protein [Yersinia pestis]
MVDVRKGPSPSFHLTRIRSFTPASQGILTAENTRRVFALLSPHGELSLFPASSHRRYCNLRWSKVSAMPIFRRGAIAC